MFIRYYMKNFISNFKNLQVLQIANNWLSVFSKYQKYVCEKLINNDIPFHFCIEDKYKYLISDLIYFYTHISSKNNSNQSYLEKEMQKLKILAIQLKSSQEKGL